MRGGRIAIQQVAVDAFGNALGYSVAGAMNGSGSVAPQAQVESDDVLGDFITKNNNWAHVDVGPMPALVNGQSFSETLAAQKTSNNPYGLPTQVARAASSGGGMWDTDAPPSIAGKYVQTYGGDAPLMGGRADSTAVMGAGPAGTQPRALQPGESIKGNLFFGGAGMDGPYIKDMVRAFGENGMSLTPVDTNKWSGGTILDATLGVDVFRTGKQLIQVLLDDFKQGGSQFNLIGYSYGSLAASQVAINYAQAGTRVDNLVLVGAPISQDFLNELKSTSNIKNVVVMDLTAQGDPIKAGMSRADLILAAPKLGYQMTQQSGHFYYAPDTAIGQVRRNDLAATLYRSGLR